METAAAYENACRAGLPAIAPMHESAFGEGEDAFDLDS